MTGIYVLQEYKGCEDGWVPFGCEGTNKEIMDFIASELRYQHPSRIYRVIEKPWEPAPPPSETSSSPTEILNMRIVELEAELKRRDKEAEDAYEEARNEYE